ncbi:MAG: hypothetical protein IJE07_05505 [Clostridia bacterium]|nr:hypothetical protein [Clostridia bacterium]
MGAWSVSITGNDTARDLLTEYSAAFSRYAPAEAVALLDAYVRRDFRAGPGDEDWVDYRYSLAQFMWKKGVLTDAVRDEVIAMIDRGECLDLYEDAATLRKRQKVLAEFRAQLLSPQPPRKPIRVSRAQMTLPYEVGDVIAMRLHTAACRTEYHRPRLSAEAFRQLDGQWFVWQMVKAHVSWRSAVVPEVFDVWPYYRMYAAVFPEVPTLAQLADVPFVRYSDVWHPTVRTALITGNNTHTGYRRREAQLIGRVDVTLPRGEAYNETMILPACLPPTFETDAEIACLLYGRQ